MKKYLLSLFLFVSVACSATVGTKLTYTVPDAGLTTTISSGPAPDYIIVYPSETGTLTGDISITFASNPQKGTMVVVVVGGFNLNGHTITILSSGFQQYQVGSSNVWVVNYFYIDGSGNNIKYDQPSTLSAGLIKSLDGGVIIDGTIDFASLSGPLPISDIDTTGRGRIWYGNSTNATSTLYAAGNAKILIGDGSDVNSKSVTGDISIANTGVTTLDSIVTDAKIATGANIKRQKLEAGSASQVVINNASGYLSSEATLNPSRGGLGANVSGSTGFVTFSAGSSTVGAISEVITLQVSFEAGYVGDFKISMPFAGTVTGIYAYATLAIAGTDDGTIVAKNNGGTTMTGGTITYTAADPRGTAYSVSPSANNTFAVNDLLTFTTAKTTAGGVVQLSITVTRSN